MSEHDTTTRPSFLIDMDGVLVHEDDLIPGADRFIKALGEAELPFLVLTNNSILTPRDFAARLARTGIDLPSESIWTSALATAQFLDWQRSPAPKSRSTPTAGRCRSWPAGRRSPAGSGWSCWSAPGTAAPPPRGP